jgi:hypothetical protein
MKIEEDKVMGFTLISGMEVVGKIVAVHDDYVELKDAYALNVQPMQGENGEVQTQVGLQPLSPFAFEEASHGGINVNLYLYTVLISVKLPESLVTQYSTMTGNIITPQSDNIVMPS